MAVRTITLGNTGVVDSGSADGRAVSTVTHVVFDGSLCENSLLVTTATTGTVAGESLVFVAAPALVVLPVEPAIGQKVTIISYDGSTDPIGVTGGLYDVNGAADGKDFSGSYAVRDFYFVGRSPGWVAGVSGGMGGTIGTFTF